MEKVIVAPASEERFVYEILEAEYRDNPEAVITRSSLRLEQTLGQGSTVKFDVLENRGNPLPQETRLQINDAFYIQELTVACGVQFTANPEGSWIPNPFPNPSTFGATDGLALEVIFDSGGINLIQDSVQLLKNLDLIGSREVGEAAEGDTTAVSEWDRNKTYQPITPSIGLNGGSSIQLSIDWGVAVDASSALAADNRIAIFMRGWLVQNGGEFNSKKPRR